MIIESVRLVALLGILGACSGPLDTRQNVDGRAFGTVFTGEIAAISVVRNLNPRGSTYSTAAGAIAERNIERNGGDSLSQIAAAAVATAITSDAAAAYYATLCMYYVRPDDPNIANAMLTSVLQGTESDAKPSMISLPQSCSSALKRGTKVILTLSLNGGTIQPMSYSQ